MAAFNLMDMLMGLGIGGLQPEKARERILPLPPELTVRPEPTTEVAQAVPPEVAQQVQPPASPPPKGVDTPVTAPNNEPAQSTAYQSPPDLANMYLKMMEDSRHAAAMDTGMTLIAAGLTPNLATRQTLIDAASSGSGAKSTLDMQDLINLQKMQTEEAAAANRKAQLPGLAKKYGLDDATVKYLDETGQLDEVVSEMANPDTEVVEAADGSKSLINKRTGETVKSLSAAKPRETEFLDMPDGSKRLVYKDDKTDVKTGEKVTEIGAAPDNQIVQSADGSNHLIDKRTGKDLGTITPAKEPGTVQLERADGSKALINEKTGEVIKELSPASVPNAEEKDELATINKEREAAGKPPMTYEEYKQMTKGGTNINIGDNGVKYPDPEKGYDYDRNPDGTVKLYEDGPHQHLIVGSPQHKEAEDIAKGEGTKEERKVGQYAITGEDTQRAIDNIEEHRDDYVSSTGMGAYLSSVYGSDAHQLSTYLNSIRANISFDKLQAMREASKTGAALGPVSDFENRLLQATQGSLDQGQDPDELIYNIKRADKLAEAFIYGYKDPKTGETRKLESQADVDELLKDIPKPPSLGGKKEHENDRGGVKSRRIK